ncbi:MAG TPA: tetratricopeptide repeat protein [Verrucomicrobiae bacterium]|nr:tetratricopeptide repeat protein [Verrucomicrobiae bacterium]
MKRLFGVVVLLLLLVPSVLADGADDRYVEIYNLIQQGDSLGTNQPAEAVAKYTEAQTALLKFQKVYPGWNERVVNFRLNYLASKITILSANTPVVSNVLAAVTSQSAEAPQTPAAPVPAPSAIVQTPAPVAPAATPAVAPTPQVLIADIQNQIAELQNQLRQVQNDKMLVEAKLREALAARPAGADPREYAQAQEKIRSMEKENELLKVSLAQEREKVASLGNAGQLVQAKLDLEDTKHQLTEQTARVNELTQQNQALQAQVKTLTANNAELASLRTENAALKKAAASKSPGDATAANAELSRQLAQAQKTIASLEADREVWRLEKDALQNRVKLLSAEPKVATAPTPLWTQDSERVKQLERERDDLQKKLDAAQKELYGRNAKATASRVDDLASQLETLRARLDIFEAKPVPYTKEELALFKKPEPVVADPHAGEKSIRELPAGTVQLVADAQRDFSERSYEQAEQKYLEVLRRDDKNVNTLANLATIQLEMGHFDDAEKNLKAALAVSPDDAFTLSILGNMKFRQGKYDEALDALSRAAKADPKNPEIQNFLGLTLSEKGMRSAAETAFRKAILLKPDYAGAQNNLAVFYLTQQPPSVELARWHYDKAIAAGFPHNPEMEKLLNEKKTADSAN